MQTLLLSFDQAFMDDDHNEHNTKNKNLKNLKLDFSYYSVDWGKKKMFNHNRLNKKKNQVSDFSDFYFSSYGHFSVIF